MKEIDSFNSLKNELAGNENLWLLLMKKGSDQSDCAYRNFAALSSEVKDKTLCVTDVNTVRDIHQEFGINSVPTLLSFERGKLKNTVKGCQLTAQYKNIVEHIGTVSKENVTSKAVKNVIVYTTPTCSWCTAVKRHFQENGIAYREINVAADQDAAMRMMQKSGQQGVPQTEINGQMVVGFDKAKINRLLEIN
ncbi:thioredoxin family protein [Maribellus sp. YY47]|uniref:thioredoxin family protein n=1 Tax=Maribellus sp. YY47 TaxID=2929486 RepID=UPI0020014A4D|nr:thioredoxin family protein [Maribellus sp. YY47]MCK3685053.1 thioredoxin family protein [Maribellus sp. YY47]